MLLIKRQHCQPSQHSLDVTRILFLASCLRMQWWWAIDSQHGHYFQPWWECWISKRWQGPCLVLAALPSPEVLIIPFLTVINIGRGCTLDLVGGGDRHGSMPCVLSFSFFEGSKILGRAYPGLTCPRAKFQHPGSLQDWLALSPQWESLPLPSIKFPMRSLQNVPMGLVIRD